MEGKTGLGTSGNQGHRDSSEYVTGGRLFFEEDPVKAVDEIEAHIMKNRKIIKFD